MAWKESCIFCKVWFLHAFSFFLSFFVIIFISLYISFFLCFYFFLSLYISFFFSSFNLSLSCHFSVIFFLFVFLLSVCLSVSVSLSLFLYWSFFLLFIFRVLAFFPSILSFQFCFYLTEEHEFEHVQAALFCLVMAMFVVSDVQVACTARSILHVQLSACSHSGLAGGSKSSQSLSV